MKRFVIILLLWTLCIVVYSQGNNTKITSVTEREDLGAYLELYTQDAVLLPEFHPTVQGKKNIEAYHKHRFRYADVTRHVRTMHDYKQVDAYVIETGTFSWMMKLQDRQPIEQTGNYLIVWEGDKRGKLRIVFEAWGSDKSVDRAHTKLLDTAHVPVKNKITFRNDAEGMQVIQLCTDEVAAAVKKRDGAAMGMFYTSDAIYIPYYSPMMVGKQKIAEYYLKHEDPKVAIDSVHIQVTQAVPVKNYMITTGVYTVRWRAGGSSGIVTGKNLNIWRREKDGKFYLYRQLANHD